MQKAQGPTKADDASSYNKPKFGKLLYYSDYITSADKNQFRWYIRQD